MKSFPELTLIGFALVSNLEAQEWTRFRGPNGSGISEAKTIPTHWTDADFNWKTPLRGTGHSSPVLWRDKIFVTSFEERTSRFLIICVDATGGQVLWQVEHPLTPSGKHDLNSYASSTPATDAERVYVCRTEPGHVTLSALDHNGTHIWERDLGPFDADHGAGTSPIVHDGAVILAKEHRGTSFWISVDASTGETRWRVPVGSDAGSYSTPAVFETDDGEAALIFNSQVRGITAVSPSTGEVLWEFREAFDKRSVSSPVIAGELIIGSCGSGGGGNYVVAIRPGSPDTGKEAERAYEVRRAAPYVPTTLCVGDWLYLWSDAGIVSRVHASDGEVQWQERAGGRFFGSPVCVDGRLFCVSSTGEVVVVGVTEEFEVLARNALNETTHSTPAVAGGRMYIHTAGHLISIGGEKPAKDGTGDDGT